MGTSNEGEEWFVGTVDVDDRRYDVSVVIEHDGIEHVGHLWFVDSEWSEDEGMRDHGCLPGRSASEVVEHARRLTPEELQLRYRRALSERRRFHGLRLITQDVLGQIRYLNRVATSMRAGLLDVEQAAGEIDNTERRLHDMVGQLRAFAGVST